MSDRSLEPKLRHVFRVLHLVGRHGGVDRELLCAETGLSRASMARLVRAIRQLYGVDLRWDRRAAEYHIAGWGVFDQARLMRHIRRLAKTGAMT